MPFQTDPLMFKPNHCQSCVQQCHCSVSQSMLNSRSTTGTSASRPQKGLRSSSAHSKSSDTAPYTKVTSVSHIKVSNPWRLEYKFEEESITFPKKILFHDYLCVRPLQVVDLRGWNVSLQIFQIARAECDSSIRALILDDVVGLNADCFEAIRGLGQLRNLSLQRIDKCPITNSIAQVIGSFKLLKYLNLNDCQASADVFVTISQTCASLKVLSVARCVGIDDSGLHALGQMIQRFRKLEKIDLTGCTDIGDNGLLDFCVAGVSLLSEINVSNCRHLTTTSMAGLRTKMPELKKLNLSNMCLGNTIYEWLTEGCRNLTHLDVSNSPELDDAGLARIGRWCRHLVDFSASKCMDITDQGVHGFFKQFYGWLEIVDFSHCIQLSSGTASTLSKHASKLREVKLNGLSKVDAVSLTALWSAAKLLVQFEMCSNLSVTTTHRKSSMPHFSDLVLTTAALPADTLHVVKFVGAFLITDVGACAMARACTHLTHIDFSYCNGISDLLLVDLALYTPHLRVFVGTGCISITSVGVQALSTGCCALSLTELEVNGCSKVMDPGLVAIANFRNLTHLGIRGCDHATDSPLLAIAESCNKLKTIDMMNLDYVSASVARTFAINCPHLTAINCEGCSFTAKEFYSAVVKMLPFATPVRGKCRLEDLPRAVINYNRYSMEVQKHDFYARKLQKFARYLISTYMIRLAKKIRRQQKDMMKRVFAAFKIGVRKSKKESLQEKMRDGAIELQYRMRRMYAIHLARLKARKLRRERAARFLLQRTFRGYASRKRTIATFTRLYVFYNLIGHMVHKYVVIRAARRNHRRILCVQAFARMLGPYIRYRLLQYAIRTLQIRWRYYAHKHKELLHKHFLERERLRLLEIKRNAAARVMQRNWKHTFFNKCMAPFILMCCIYYRTDYDDKKWSSTIMQRRWRGYMVRLKKYRREEAFRRTYNAAVKIQSVARMRIARKHFFPYRKYLKRLNKRWRALCVYSRPKLRIGIHVKVVQKYARRFVFIMRRHYAALHLQRIYRGYRTRCKWLVLLYELHTQMVTRIKRVFLVFKCRQRRKLMVARRHMAAYKIWALINRMFEPRRRQVAMAAAAKKAWEAKEAHKLELLYNKRVKLVHRIKMRYHNVLAQRIQKAYRKYRARKLARIPTPSKIRRASNMAEAMAAKKPKPAAVMMAPVRAAKRLMNSLANPFGPSEIITDKDNSKITNSVLKYQVKNILQEGLENIHLTLGEMEEKNFQNTQNSYIRGHLEHFVKLPQDLSGELNLLIFLWVKYGSGKGCICQIQIVPKPPSMSMAGMKIRVHKLLQEGVKVAWNHHVHFEVHGICSVLQGKGDFAIQAVKIATSQEEADGIENSGGFTCAGDLAKLGMHTSIWTTARKPAEEDNLYKFVLLSTYEWFDERLVRICKGFNLTEDNVMTMRAVFEEVIAGRKQDKVRANEIFKHIDYPYNQLAQWVFQAIEPDSKTEMMFSEYVHMVCFYVMLAHKELAKFLFQNIDTDKKQYLREDQYHQLIDILGEDSPFNKQGWHLQYKYYYDKKLNYYFIGNFEKFIHQNPGVLWQAQAMQRKFMKFNIGVAYWENKMEQFRVIRADLGIKLL